MAGEYTSFRKIKIIIDHAHISVIGGKELREKSM